MSDEATNAWEGDPDYDQAASAARGEPVLTVAAWRRTHAPVGPKGAIQWWHAPETPHAKVPDLAARTAHRRTLPLYIAHDLCAAGCRDAASPRDPRVAGCRAYACPCWPYRRGTNPFRAGVGNRNAKLPSPELTRTAGAGVYPSTSENRFSREIGAKGAKSSSTVGSEGSTEVSDG